LKDSAAKTQRPKSERDSFLETIESFVVAFILAFVFRAYVVEAFVIPTGSMAPRLNGQHLEYVCPQCGFRYNVGLDPPQDGRPAPLLDARPICPQCFAPQDRESQIDCGDRILVLKYFYHFFPPQRWDVIVFKYPKDPTTNYIKRLIGLPDETIQIHHGDVYVKAKGADHEVIARKPDRAQEALWMTVCDSNFPDVEHQNHPRWQVDGAAQTDGSSSAMPWTVTPRSGQTAWLSFQQRDENGRDIPIKDFFGYDDWTSYGPGYPGDRQDCQYEVTDLDLRTTVELKAPGAVTLLLRAYDDQFRAELPTTGRGKIVLIRETIGRGGAVRSETLAEGPESTILVGQPVELELANVDQKIILKVNGRRIIDRTGTGRFNEDDDFDYTPVVPRRQWTGDPRGWTDVKLGLQEGAAVVRRLRINRDVYYTNPIDNGASYAVEGHPYEVKSDEYFALGDNSPRSSDGRYWGPIPQENLIGKAFFVYWPSAGARYGIPLRAVPDVKGFRMIR
jgi:signal peptidase I